MNIDYKGCTSAEDQFVLQRLAQKLENVYRELYANFLGRPPYVLAYANGWHTYTVDELCRLTGQSQDDLRKEFRACTT